MSEAASSDLTKKDFVSDQEVRWCPGCGDYAILNAVQQTFAELGLRPEKVVIVSGIGCSSRFPYYMNTYGFHTIHGRAPAVATGLKVARPDLDIWVITGDGDALSIGGNHLIHALRRNVGLKVLLFNNRIYGLTKGQYSPTSELGKRTKSSPVGSVDRPFNPLSLALGSDATFVARSIDTYATHLREVLRRAHAHPGAAFVEIYQNCNIFNDNAFTPVRERSLRGDNVVELQHGEPLVFGKNRDRGIRLDGLRPEVVELTDDVTDGLLVHDESLADPTLAFLLGRLDQPRFPVPLGVFRAVEEPVFDELMNRQVEETRAASGAGDLEKLLYSGDVWKVS